jgi:flagellar biosynthesis chaperone FliJ
MSGFETSKFVDLNESLETHLSCGICYGIYNKPVETQCGHTFCEQCIKQWFENDINKSCPFCKQQLGNKRKRNTRNDNSFDSNVLFSKSQRILLIIDLINDLKIKCDFVSNGCQEVLKLVSLSKHLEECDYNLCITCGIKMGKKDEHNCIELLKKERDYYKQQSSESKKEVDKYKADFIVAKNQLKIKSISFEEEKNKLKQEISKSENEKQELKAQIEKLIDYKEKINNKVNDEVIVDSKVEEQDFNLANNDFIE